MRKLEYLKERAAFINQIFPEGGPILIQKKLPEDIYRNSLDYFGHIQTHEDYEDIIKGNNKLFPKDHIFFFDHSRSVYPNIKFLLFDLVHISDRHVDKGEKAYIISVIYPILHYYYYGYSEDNLGDALKEKTKVYYLGRRNIYKKHFTSVVKHFKSEITDDPSEADVFVIGDLVLDKEIDSQKEIMLVKPVNFSVLRKIIDVLILNRGSRIYRNVLTTVKTYSNDPILIFENDINNYYLNNLEDRKSNSSVSFFKNNKCIIL